MIEPEIYFHSYDALFEALGAKIDLELPDPNKHFELVYKKIVKVELPDGVLKHPTLPKVTYEHYKKHAIGMFGKIIQVWVKE